MQTIDTNEWRDHRSASYLEAHDKLGVARSILVRMRDLYRAGEVSTDAFLAAMNELDLAVKACDEAEQAEIND